MKNRNKLKFHYDSEVDVLYAKYYQTQKTEYIEAGNGTSLRVDPETNDVIGFIITNYKKRIDRGILKKVPGFEEVELPQFN